MRLKKHSILGSHGVQGSRSTFRIYLPLDAKGEKLIRAWMVVLHRAGYRRSRLALTASSEYGDVKSDAFDHVLPAEQADSRLVRELAALTPERYMPVIGSS